jgi:alkylhydroperoxidase family enzyme
MTDLSYENAPAPIRADLAETHRRLWRHLANPGTWLDGETRVAIAAETRNAPACALCRRRNAALSPYGDDGAHDHLGALAEPIVEIIHRVVTDPARLKKAWYRDLLENGITEEQYVEILGVVCTIVSVDSFAKAMGMAPPDLPEPIAGNPSRVRPSHATQGAAWVPWIAREDAVGEDLRNFGPEGSNVRRALSLVPAEAHSFMDMVAVQYLSAEQMFDFDNDPRVISRQQIELIAGRVSAINQCAY